jgi:hypothetical protein
VALHRRSHGRRLRRGGNPGDRSATSPTPSRARTSSATPSCSAASGRGACTPRRSRSRDGCSARPPRTSGGRARSSPRWATAPAR